MTALEIVATVFGLACVGLTIRRNIWCWPTGIVSGQQVWQEMFERFLAALARRGRPYEIIRGDWATRFARRGAVRKLIGEAEPEGRET